jgi:predicted transcriptional regulator
MSKTNRPKNAPLVAFQIKLKPEIRERIFKAAKDRNLSASDIASMALSAGIDRVEQKLREIQEPLAA